MSTVRLTRCQRQVFDLIVLGKSNRDIAADMGRAEKSVKSHVTALLKRFACGNRCELIVRHYRGML